MTPPTEDRVIRNVPCPFCGAPFPLEFKVWGSSLIANEAERHPCPNLPAETRPGQAAA